MEIMPFYNADKKERGCRIDFNYRELDKIISIFTNAKATLRKRDKQAIYSVALVSDRRG